MKKVNYARLSLFIAIATFGYASMFFLTQRPSPGHMLNAIQIIAVILAFMLTTYGLLKTLQEILK